MTAYVLRAHSHIVSQHGHVSALGAAKDDVVPMVVGSWAQLLGSTDAIGTLKDLEKHFCKIRQVESK